MKKILNNPEDFEKETMEGILLAYEGKVKNLNGDFRVLLSDYPSREGKVGVVTAGGSGHLPVFLGYVGQGMLDGCCIGNIFASPSAQKMADMIKACDQGSGVLCLFGNYGGDKMNFDLACEIVEIEEGIGTRTVLVRDDIASSAPDEVHIRRGVAGMVFAFKIAGAAAEAGLSIDEVTDLTEEALANIRTMGVAISPCIIPQIGKPSFLISDDEIEIGMGIHGEPGIETRKMITADEIADLIMDKIMTEIKLCQGDEISVMVNGLGATPLEEQFIVYRRIALNMRDKNITIIRPHIGEFATSMEMGGLSVTIMKMNERLKPYFESPAVTPFYTNLNK
jgi:dihydroxyacetone kinase-like protein